VATGRAVDIPEAPTKQRDCSNRHGGASAAKRPPACLARATPPARELLTPAAERACAVGLAELGAALHALAAPVPSTRHLFPLPTAYAEVLRPLPRCSAGCLAVCAPASPLPAGMHLIVGDSD
jgi:hypothetical protein